MVEVKPYIGKGKKVKRDKRIPEPLPVGTRKQEFCWSFLARRGSGKSSLIAGLIHSYYAKIMDQIIWVSPSVYYDDAPQSLAEYENVTFRDEIDNESLQQIFDIQKQRAAADPSKSLLLILDDCGVLAKSKHLRSTLNKLYTTCRHFSMNLITVFQHITQLEGQQFSNSTQWCLFNMERKTFEKLAHQLQTPSMPEKELVQYLVENTAAPHSFVYVDNTHFHKKFEEAYK